MIQLTAPKPTIYGHEITSRTHKLSDYTNVKFISLVFLEVKSLYILKGSFQVVTQMFVSVSESVK